MRKNKDENDYQFIWRVSEQKDSLGLGWEELTEIFNKELDKDYTSAAYRKPYSSAKIYFDNVFSKFEENEELNRIKEEKIELELQTIQLRDERNSRNNNIRIEARVKNKLDTLEYKLKEISKKEFSLCRDAKITSNNDLLIILSDTHFGQTFKSNFGEYNSDIAKKRLDKYLIEITRLKNLFKSENCYVSIQGDLISGSIHKQLAITNRENTIEQIKLASEYISSFLFNLCELFSSGEVYAANCSGNHTRIDRKEDSLQDERLDDLIGWAIKLLLSKTSNFTWIGNNIDTSISEFEIRGKKYVNVHGDYDGFSETGVAKLSMMLGYFPYAITYGHLHECSYDSKKNIKLVRGGSLAGTGDGYTIEKRIKGRASQAVCVCTNNGILGFFPIDLEGGDNND